MNPEATINGWTVRWYATQQCIMCTRPSRRVFLGFNADGGLIVNRFTGFAARTHGGNLTWMNKKHIANIVSWARSLDT